MQPLQEPTFLVLAALAAEPLYGYAIIQTVAGLSGGRVELRPGTLYPALDRLTTDGLVEVARDEVVDGRLRRYYQLTDAGAARLRADADRQRRNALAATRRLATRDAGPAAARSAQRRRSGDVAPA
jgi:DNA-binding PadR family transcriptional regulator